MTHDPHRCDCEACKTWRKATGNERVHERPQTLFGRPIVYRDDLPTVDVQVGTLTREAAAKTIGYVCPKCGRGIESVTRQAVEVPSYDGLTRRFEPGKAAKCKPCGCVIESDEAKL